MIPFGIIVIDVVIIITLFVSGCDGVRRQAKAAPQLFDSQVETRNNDDDNDDETPSASTPLLFRDKTTNRASAVSQIQQNRYQRRERSSSLQPRVTVVQKAPTMMLNTDLTNPNGTIWCGGRPTFWITGHDNHESPFCLTTNGKWVFNETVQLDHGDKLNSADGSGGMDRHACVSLDVNKDGIEDIICSVGAVHGTGEGYNELYLTQANGTIQKVLQEHGLYKHRYMRTRFTVTLRNKEGVKEYVFIATIGGERDDGKPNEHRMYRNVYKDATKFPYFVEVLGPWITDFIAECAVSGDFTHDKSDDLIVCNAEGNPLLVRQVPSTKKNNKSAASKFFKVPLPNSNKDYMKYWRNVRLADVTGDGLVDLIVVTFGQPSYMYIFRGIAGTPYFDFIHIHFQTKLAWSSPDVEVLDVNSDGLLDIYVVQVNEEKTGIGKGYCAEGVNAKVFWGNTHFPPPGFKPPRDQAQDVLFLGAKNQKWFRVVMNHSQPGCGYLVKRWDDNTLLLGNGNWDSAGPGLLLQW